MSAYNFFSNNLVYVDSEDCEIIKSLSNTRPSVETIFPTPEHTVDTPNLLVFVNGILQIKDVDYTDRNSFEIGFTRNIGIHEDVVIILVKSKNAPTHTNKCNIEWGSF